MFKHSCTHLTTLTKQRVLQWLGTIETVLFDADGVLWDNDKPIASAVNAFNTLRAAGKRNYIVTNNTTVSCDGILKKAISLGLETDKDHIISASLSVADYLANKKFQKKVFLVGESGISEELANLDICSFTVKPEPMNKSMKDFTLELKLDPDVGAIVVGRDDNFNVPTLIRANSYLQNRRILFLGAGMDKGYPIGENRRMVVGGGPIIAAIKTVSERKPLILGKPNPWMLRRPISAGLINPETTLMIGDTIQTDIMFAYNTGCQSLLVGTGVSSLKDVAKIRNSGNDKMMVMVPDFYLPNLEPISEHLC
ncbi:GH14576 [Drosophila grimshawi]|uniref:GH14576 n=2 Tax=Drosophila grimshawi TaxID=7222 RepID=B4IYI9_DROGR|nr:GH14576 [Drosophila grimshawi]